MLEAQRTMTLDHVISTLTVTIRTLDPITVQEIKDQIEKKYEVVEIRMGKQTWVPTIHRD